MLCIGSEEYKTLLTPRSLLRGVFMVRLKNGRNSKKITGTGGEVKRDL